MSDTLLLIHKLTDETQCIWRDIAGSCNEVELREARERLKALAVKLGDLWDDRRKELAGEDYPHALGFASSPARGRLNLHSRHGGDI